MPIERVKKAIEDIKKGKMIVMIDDEDRENEGDVVYAATFSTPDKVNFMATYAKGLICVSLTKDIADRLNLHPMVKNNDSSYETAFTISVDARECSTGISAYERDLTIRLLSDYNSKPSDFVRPGHIFPLIAKEGGTLVRTGHTEGSVDICKLAGVAPVAVICEIMKDDGTMARRKDLEIFAKEHDLSIVYISDIIEYRLKNEYLVKTIAQSNTKFLGNDVVRVDFLDHQENHHIAFLFKDRKKEALVRFHHIGRDFDFLTKDNNFNKMMKSIELLKKEGGVLIFLDSSENKEKSEMRDFGIGAQIVKKLGIEKMRILVGSKGKEFIGIGGFGLDIVEEIEIC